MKLSQVFRRDKQPPSTDPTIDLVAGLSSYDLAALVRTSLNRAKDYARWRRHSWRLLASGTHLLGLLLSASATVVLGLADLEGAAQWGFVLSSLVTAVGAIEPFFNWRSRWVLAEGALARWHKTEEDLTLYVAGVNDGALDRKVIMQFYADYRSTWDDFSEQWLAQRSAKAERGALGDSRS